MKLTYSEMLRSVVVLVVNYAMSVLVWQDMHKLASSGFEPDSLRPTEESGFETMLLAPA